MRALLFPVLAAALALPSTSCLGVVRESYYRIESSVGEPEPRDSPIAPYYRMPSGSGEVTLKLQVTDYAAYEVLSGPLLAMVIPLFLVSWIWHEPLPGDSLSVHLSPFGPRGEIELRPEEVLLRLPDGTEIAPSATEPGPPKSSITYRVPGAGEGAYVLLVNGVYLSGVRQSFAPVSLQRSKCWRIMAIGMDGRVLWR